MTNLEQFKNKQLEILHELDRVCKQADINYYLAYGTCLGAVRHQGFIPWDDDIDVFLTCGNMKKLLKNRKLFKENYFVQCRDTDPNYCNMKFSLRDSSTAYFADEMDNQDINHGMFIDMYVLYPYPDNFFVAHKLIIDTFVLRLLYMKRAPVNHGIAGKVAYKVLLTLYPGKRAEKKIKNIEARLQNNGGSKYYASFFGDDITPLSCFRFPKEYFGEPKLLQFEDYLAPCPSNPEKICERAYGKTYMVFPSKEQRISRHRVLYMSCDKPYTKFVGKYYIKDNERGI